MRSSSVTDMVMPVPALDKARTVPVEEANDCVRERTPPVWVQVPTVTVQLSVIEATAPDTVRVVAAALMVKALFRLSRLPELVTAVV